MHYRRSTLKVIAVAMAVAALGALPSTLDAQVIRGTVVGRGETAGVPGVVVLLVDSTGAIVGRALSAEGGEYRVTAPRAGTYRVRTMRIGFRPDTSAVIVMGPGQERVVSLVLANVAAMLDTVRVAERSVCHAAQAGDVTAAIWEQVRTTLMSAQLTARLRAVKATIVTYERTLDPNTERIRQQAAGVISGLTARPWTSLPPDSLRKVGYVVSDRDGSVSYFAPDFEVLLSPNFVIDHCFRIRQDRDTTLLGIAFEPTKDRARVAEIAGTLWLARRTSELRRLEFHYVNAEGEFADRANGEMEFARMSNGGWAIAKWGIKMPVVERRLGARAEFSLYVAELRSVGGELSHALSGTDTLFARPPFTLAGSVLDSTSGAPVAGAELQITGTTLAGRSDAKGRFSIVGMLPGEYTIDVRAPSYASVNAAVRWPLLFIDDQSPVTIRIPSATEIASARSATFTGRVVADTTNLPIAGANVYLSGTGLTVFTNDSGAFRLSDVPPGAHEVTVRKVGYGPLTTTVTFPERRRVDRRIVLTRVTVLDTVVVEARSLAGFEANRALGLGRYLTGAQLEKAAGRMLQAVMRELPGVDLVEGRGSHAWVRSSRVPRIAKGMPLRPNTYVPERWEALLGLTANCYAQVYPDKMLLNPGRPTPPFDIHTLAPESLAAVEWYAGNQLPPEYDKRNADCGVVVLHTRRGK